MRNGFGNGLAAIDDSKFGVKPPKRGFGVKLGGRELYQSIARIWFAYIKMFQASISHRFRVISMAHFVTDRQTDTQTHVTTR